MSESKLDRFQARIGYTFKDISLLRTALTHSSYIKSCPEDEKQHNNERLEFLGDAVLGLCVGEQVFRTYKDASEGAMSRARAAAVCETALFEASKEIGIPECILLSYGESISGGRDKPSILSDALEALIGAIYLDGGLEEARKFILSFTDIRSSFKLSKNKDEKTRLQEFVQDRHMGNISYEVVEMKGPDHRREFTIVVKIGGKVFGQGIGFSKHEAGKNAAGEALKNLTEH